MVISHTCRAAAKADDIVHCSIGGAKDCRRGWDLIEWFEVFWSIGVCIVTIECKGEIGRDIKPHIAFNICGGITQVVSVCLKKCRGRRRSIDVYLVIDVGVTVGQYLKLGNNALCIAN